MKRIFTGIALLAALLAFSTGSALAQEITPITGTVQLVEFDTDPDTGETFAIVTLENADGSTQTVNMTLETAEAYGLIDTSSGAPVVSETAYGTEVTIEPTDVLPETPGEEGDDEDQHPVGGALSEFFSDLLGVDYDTVMTAHSDGVGFGVIAQALWMTNQIGGDTETFNALLEAKKTGDYSNITLADGSTPDNWGDIVKGLKKGENLGSVMSGKADAPTTNPTSTTTVEGTAGTQNGNDNGNGIGNNANNNGQGNGNVGGNGNGNGSGNGNGNGNGNGKGKGNNGSDDEGGNGKGKGNGKP